MDSSKVMVTLSDGTAITLDDYARVFSSAAADSPKIEGMELSLYRTRMETERLARSMHQPATQTTSDTTNLTASDHDASDVQGTQADPAVTVTQSPDGVVLVNVPNGMPTATNPTTGDGDTHDAITRQPSERHAGDRHDDDDIDLDVDIPTPQATRRGRRICAPSRKGTTGDGMRRATTSFVFSPSDTEIPESGPFEYMPPESYEEASASVPVTLPVIGESAGFVSEMSVLASRKAVRRPRRRH